jgi:hypothetical protein
MLYPKCPLCGGKSTTDESDSIDYSNRHVARFASGRATGHNHPALAMFSMALSAGRFVYKRVPGGGKKRCTACGHRFS